MMWLSGAAAYNADRRPNQNARAPSSLRYDRTGRPYIIQMDRTNLPCATKNQVVGFRRLLAS
jgi:hypothetical protein